MDHRHHIKLRYYFFKTLTHANLLKTGMQFGLITTTAMGLMIAGNYAVHADTNATSATSQTSSVNSSANSSVSSSATSQASSFSSSVTDSSSVKSQASSSSSLTSSNHSSGNSSIATSSNTSSSTSSATSSSNSDASSSTSSTSVNDQTSSASSVTSKAVASANSSAQVGDQSSLYASLKATNVQLATHLQLKNGAIYYNNSNQQPVSSFLIDNNGSLLYFDASGKLAALPSSDLSTNLQTIITDSHNRIFSLDANSITNTDGYITANSWYRPQAILKNGTDWTTSTDKDFRPILTVWWPTKTVQANYLNYMTNLGLGKTGVQYSNDTEQDALNAAAKDVQENIEKKISVENGNMDWLVDTINNFIKTQPQWNSSSEGVIPQTFQGGTLKYTNNDATGYANSNYRLLNRYPTNQTGTPNWKLNALQGGGSEFLLANDIDNSNPAVQAEQLNWLYYLMNFGSITNQGKGANFDSYRVDAVDNVDADLLQVASNYFKAAYKINQNDQNANNHLSILEDWSYSADPTYVNQKGANQLPMDFQFKAWEAASLMKDASQRISLSNMIKTLVNRKSDTTDNKAIPNYSFIRAHDSEVQTIIQKIITDQIDPTSSGTTFTQAQLKQAFKIYDADEKATDKKYTPYNIPLGYALLLTNKDTVPRVYYGDMYTDDGQYMAHRSPYYMAIKQLLANRIKYFAGGQAMQIKKVNGNEVLTSVRYGKGVNRVNQKVRDKVSKTSGMALLMTNTPQTTFKANSKIAVQVGKLHANQKYQLILQSTKNGLTYHSNNRLRVDRNGVLHVPSAYLTGQSNPQVSGSISMWVPVGAKTNQDIRVAATTKKSSDGKTYHSNPALDSHVIFEGFSNFQAMPKKTSQYSNVKIQKHAKFFANLGITDFEFPPQYRSSTDSSFIDSIVKNGYSFTDRYDLGFNNADGSTNPTKYGTATQLGDAIKAVHRYGMKAIADWVPDQVYNLPNTQVVTATRVNSDGSSIVTSDLVNTLYESHTLGSNNDYQAKYGGAFLNLLKQKYPALFKVKMISNGKTLPVNEPIKQWSAKYFNGTNIQGSGIGFVLSDTNNSGYFTVPNVNNTAIKDTFLPQQLLGKNVTYGFFNDGANVTYTTINGYQVKNAFYQAPDGNWYYFDDQGHMVKKPMTINGANYYFLPNGVNLRNTTVLTNGKLYYYEGDGKQLTTPGTYTIKTIYPPLNANDDDNTTINTNITVNYDGTLLTGLSQGKKGVLQYFNDDGTQVLGGIVKVNGSMMFFDPASGNVVKNQFFQVTGDKTHWYYANQYGIVATGLQKIDGQYNYFDQNTGVQIKGAVVNVGPYQVYLDSANGTPVKNQLVGYNGKWYFAGSDTHLISGWHTYQHHKLYFGFDNAQVKGQIVQLNQNLVYLDPNSGQIVKNQDITFNNTTYHANRFGHLKAK